MSEDKEVKSFQDFFSWCSEQNLIRSRDIARSFGRTPQTINNWKAKKQTDIVPLHISLSCIGYEEIRKETGLMEPINVPLTIAIFDIWRHYYKLNTFEKTAEVFGLTRQAVHHWYVRRRLPSWVNIACHGYAYKNNLQKR